LGINIRFKLNLIRSSGMLTISKNILNNEKNTICLLS
jgi:hypothetical protein